jgi:hypothetical protein
MAAWQSSSLLVILDPWLCVAGFHRFCLFSFVALKFIHLEAGTRYQVAKRSCKVLTTDEAN